MAQITIDIPDEWVDCYDKPEYIILVTAERRWNQPVFAAAVVKSALPVADGIAEEIGEDTSIKKLLGSIASDIWKERK